MSAIIQNIILYSNNILKDGELKEKATVHESLTVQTEGKPYMLSLQALLTYSLKKGKLCETI